jgi:hypothetical protein
MRDRVGERLAPAKEPDAWCAGLLRAGGESNETPLVERLKWRTTVASRCDRNDVDRARSGDNHDYGTIDYYDDAASLRPVQCHGAAKHHEQRPRVRRDGEPC